MDGMYEFVFIGSHGGGTGKLLIAGGNVLGKDTGGVIYGGSLPDGIGIRAAVPPNMTWSRESRLDPAARWSTFSRRLTRPASLVSPFRSRSQAVRSRSRSENWRAFRKRPTSLGAVTAG